MTGPAVGSLLEARTIMANGLILAELTTALLCRA
jgi:hypothetical protein